MNTFVKLILTRVVRSKTIIWILNDIGKDIASSCFLGVANSCNRKHRISDFSATKHHVPNPVENTSSCEKGRVGARANLAPSASGQGANLASLGADLTPFASGQASWQGANLTPFATLIWN